MSRITVRYWAAAKDAAARAEDHVDAATLADALAAVRTRHAAEPRFERVLAQCSLLVDGQPVGRRDPETVQLDDGASIEVLPPFAGG